MKDHLEKIYETLKYSLPRNKDSIENFAEKIVLYTLVYKILFDFNSVKNDTDDNYQFKKFINNKNFETINLIEIKSFFSQLVFYANFLSYDMKFLKTDFSKLLAYINENTDENLNSNLQPLLKDFLETNDFKELFIKSNFRELAIMFKEACEDFNLVVDSYIPYNHWYWKEASSDLGFLISNLLNIQKEDKLLDLSINNGSLAFQSNANYVAGFDMNSQNSSYSKFLFSLANIENNIDSYNDANIKEIFETKVDFVISDFTGNWEFDLDKFDFIKEPIIKRRANKIPADLLFFSRIPYLAKKMGLLIVPESLLFSNIRGSQNIREELLENKAIRAVISLPAGFYNFSSLKASIIVFNPCSNDNDNVLDRNNNILFIDLKNKGKKVRARTMLEKQTIKEIIEIYNNNKLIKGLSNLVSTDVVLKNNSILSVNTYMEIVEDECSSDELKYSMLIAFKNFENYKKITDKILSEL